MPFFGSSKVKLLDRPLLFIDLEMSGLDVDRHEILEIAALLVDPKNFEIKSSYYSKIVPEHIHTADPQALEVVGYDPKNWHDAIPLRQMLSELSALAPNCILAGWSVQNEWDFLLAALKKENLPYFFYNYLLEVSTLVYIKHRNKLPSLGMSAVSRHFKIPLDQHKPDSDIRATYEIFKRLLAEGSL